ncbi:MAG: hypothetical protein JJU10_08215 [Idiomarina sp.]|nr:hypothetical protein [Idiomarina sp.]
MKMALGCVCSVTLGLNWDKSEFCRDWLSYFSRASSDNAANWLHENVHSKLKVDVDVEVGAFIYQSGEEFYIGELQTDSMTNSVNLNMTDQAHASWHSHGTHKGLYWRPTLQDVELDIGQELRWGYTSTTHNGHALWRFDVHGFNASKAPINWDTTRAHMCNLRREGDC